MRLHNAHHFVPAFILREWQTPPDDTLSAFSWLNGALIHRRYKARSVAKQLGLYALRSKEGVADNVIEREFFARTIDEQAAPVHKKILEHGMKSLNANDWSVWDRFMVAQMLRSPRMIAHLRSRGAEIFAQPILAEESGHDIEDFDLCKFVASDWIENNPDSLSTDNLSMVMLPAIVNSDLLLDKIKRAVPVLIELPSTAPFDYLIGDHGLSYVGAMQDKFVIMLPIAPRVGFVKCDSRETAARISKLCPLKLASDANYTTITSAEQYVYATDASQSRYIEMNLIRSD